jgi:hypothetical protein
VLSLANQALENLNSLKISNPIKYYEKITLHMHDVSALVIPRRKEITK